MRHFLSFLLAAVARTQARMPNPPFPGRTIIRNKITKLTSACQEATGACKDDPSEIHLSPLPGSADLSGDVRFP